MTDLPEENSMSLRKHERISKAITDGLFADMQNPQYQGANFTWDRFADLVRGRVEADLFIYYSQTPKNFEQVKQQAGQYAFDYATDLVTTNKDSLVVFAQKQGGA